MSCPPSPCWWPGRTRRTLVLSQVVLAFGVPVALVPLVRLTVSRTAMGRHVNRMGVTVRAAVIAILITSLDWWLVVAR